MKLLGLLMVAAIVGYVVGFFAGGVLLSLVSSDAPDAVLGLVLLYGPFGAVVAVGLTCLYLAWRGRV